MNLEKYQRLKESLESLKEERDRAVGALSEMKKRLLKEFGCKTIKEAVKLHTEMEKEQEKLKEEYQNEYEKIYDKWGHLLDGE